jgi:hypothetical protein
LIEADPNLVVEGIWAALRSLDSALPALPTEGVGESSGDTMGVRWARSASELFFVSEVIDHTRGEVWEVGVADPGYEHPIGFWRRVLGGDNAPPAPWRVAVADRCALEPHQPRSEPTFLKLIQAFARESGTFFSDDAGARAALEDEATYWRDLAKKQVEAHRTERAADRRRLEALGASSGASLESVAEQERIWRLDELEEWTAKHCDRIVVLPRALAAAKKSEYHEPRHVYDALNLLGNDYPRLKNGEITHAQFKHRCDETGVDYSRSVDRSVAGEAGDEYFVKWKGRRLFLSHHLGRGTSRDPRFALRIYFTWDDEDNIAVVGWLPSHLTASMS